jgi:hypothetical protein
MLHLAKCLCFGNHSERIVVNMVLSSFRVAVDIGWSVAVFRVVAGMIPYNFCRSPASVVLGQ